MLAEGLEARIVDTCHLVTADMFSLFINPKNQGRNFSWESFSELVIPHSQLFVEMNVLPKFRKYDKDGVSRLVRATCRVYAERLINNAGFIRSPHEPPHAHVECSVEGADYVRSWRLAN